MLASGRRLAETIGLATRIPSFRARLKPQIKQIYALVRELRGLSEDEIKIVEEATATRKIYVDLLYQSDIIISVLDVFFRHDSMGSRREYACSVRADDPGNRSAEEIAIMIRQQSRRHIIESEEGSVKLSVGEPLMLPNWMHVTPNNN